MQPNRRQILALGAALPLLAAPARAAVSETPVDAGLLWRNLFADGPGQTFAWWFQGTMSAHVDRLREFPVAGLHAIMIARASVVSGGLAVDFRTIGCFSDLDSGQPTANWHNVFTDTAQDIPAFYAEGPGRYVLLPGADGPSLSLSSAATRTNRAVATGEIVHDRATLTQIEGTLQGFPQLGGALPAIGSPTITERQTRLQIIAPRGLATGPIPVAEARGFFSHVYDALPDWMGFGETLGSGLSKGQMRKADATTIVDATVWAYLKHHVPSAFAGDRLVLA